MRAPIASSYCAKGRLGPGSALHTKRSCARQGRRRHSSSGPATSSSSSSGMAAHAIAACLLLAWGHPRYQLAIRTQTAALPDGAADLRLDPLLAVEIPRPSLQLSARYLPTMLLRARRERGTFDLLHRGILSGTLRLSRDRRLVAEQRLARGPTD